MSNEEAAKLAISRMSEPDSPFQSPNPKFSPQPDVVVSSGHGTVNPVQITNGMSVESPKFESLLSPRVATTFDPAIPDRNPVSGEGDATDTPESRMALRNEAIQKRTLLKRSLISLI